MAIQINPPPRSPSPDRHAARTTRTRTADERETRKCWWHPRKDMPNKVAVLPTKYLALHAFAKPELLLRGCDYDTRFAIVAVRLLCKR
jgi:hypothetical protein